MSQPKPARLGGCNTFFFGLCLIVPFLAAHAADWTRDGSENLFLQFYLLTPVVVPFMFMYFLLMAPYIFAIAAIGIYTSRFLWNRRPIFAPRGLSSQSSRPPMYGALPGTILAGAWYLSPLLTRFHDSCSIMVMLFAGGWILYLVYERGRVRSVAHALLSSAFAATVAFPILALVADRRPDSMGLWGEFRILDPMIISYIFTVALYDWYYKTLALKNAAPPERIIHGS